MTINQIGQYLKASHILLNLKVINPSRVLAFKRNILNLTLRREKVNIVLNVENMCTISTRCEFVGPKAG